MNKKTTLYILLDLVFLIVFNTVFFVIGGSTHSASVWISYVFIHLSYFMMLLTPFLIRKSSNASVFGFTLTSISATYFFVEFIIGLIFILIGSESFKAALVTQIIIAGIYAVLLISNLIANEHTDDSVECKKNQVDYTKNASSRVKLLIGKVSDIKANKRIENVYDLIHSSPSNIGAQSAPIENEIVSKLYFLEDAVSADNTQTVLNACDELISLINKRNELSKH